MPATSTLTLTVAQSASEWPAERLEAAARTAVMIAQVHAWSRLHPAFAALRHLERPEVAVTPVKIAQSQLTVTWPDTPWGRLAGYLTELGLADRELAGAIAVTAGALQISVGRAGKLAPVIAIVHDDEPWIVDGAGTDAPSLVGRDRTLALAALPTPLQAHIDRALARGYGDDGLSACVLAAAHDQHALQAALRSGRRAIAEAALAEVRLLAEPSAATLDAVLACGRLLGADRLTSLIGAVAGSAVRDPDAFALLMERVVTGHDDERALALTALAGLVGYVRYADRTRMKTVRTEADQIRPLVAEALDSAVPALQRAALRLCRREALRADWYPNVMLAIVEADRDAATTRLALQTFTAFGDWPKHVIGKADVLRAALERHRPHLGKDADRLETRLEIIRMRGY